MGKLRANSEIISDKSKNPVTTSTYIKHGNQWLDDAVNNAIGAAASKADKTYVDSELTKKANKSDTDAALSSKADKSALEATNASVSANTSNIQELSTESTVLSARMDEFTKLEEGSTTGDAELIDGRIGSDGKTYDNIGGAIRGQVTDLKSEINGGKVIKLYKNISDLTQDASTGAANAYLHSTIFPKGKVKSIKVNASAAGTIKVYLYALNNNKLVPFEMFFVNAVSGENTININKLISVDFYIAFAAYNNAKVKYVTDYSSISNNTAYISAGEEAANTFSGNYSFAISVQYAALNTVWEYINSVQPPKSLYLNVPDSAMTSKTSTGGANAYFSFEKISGGYIKRIKVLELESGTITCTLYRQSGDYYVPFAAYSKSVTSGTNYIDVGRYIYSDFYVAIRGKIAYANKSIGSNNAKWISANAAIPVSETPSGNFYFGLQIEYGNYDESVKYKSRICTLHDAYMAWKDGLKFPVCFAGDSTTDGYQTTGYTANVVGTDHVLPNVYTKKLEDLLKAETGNANLRIYNAGFSGQTAAWFDDNFNAEIINNRYYADTAMLGISFGINDRPENKAEYDAVKSRIVSIIKKCYDNNIQPFLLTCQAGTEYSSRVSRYENITTAYANEIKRELANEYNLELIDVAEFTHNFITYSNYTGAQIIADHCHFNDIGHNYEAGMFFANLIPRTIWVNGSDKIGFDTAGLKTALSSDANEASDIKTLSTNINGFKLKASVESSTDKIIMDVWFFVDSKNPMELKSYCDHVYNQTVFVDDVEYEISAAEQVITSVDLGLHHIVVHSNSGNVNFLGFKLS